MSFIADVCPYLESINIFFKFKVSGVPESCPARLHSQLFHFPHILEVSHLSCKGHFTPPQFIT